GNQDEQEFLFDPEIERTLRKLKKQSKASRQLNFEEVEENMIRSYLDTSLHLQPYLVRLCQGSMRCSLECPLP
ncbi:hypothetical protein PIB30_110204, partial [Stylosanthes scabra]|nr:hypothetical protein [Stylosanthes scabra]